MPKKKYAETIPGLENLVKEKWLAHYANVSLSTVRRWREVGGGPPFYKLGNAIRYKPTEIDKWIDALPSQTGNRDPKGRP